MRLINLLTCLLLLTTCLVGLPAPAHAEPSSYPPDPNADIEWNAGTGGVVDIQAAFNHARAQENAQLGLSLPMLTLPSQSTWDALSNGEKALWLINADRRDRGLLPLHGI
ncbi:MAG TPA: hypothetical protein VF831_05000, partial [Anaerolineales bacterium]